MPYWALARKVAGDKAVVSTAAGPQGLEPGKWGEKGHKEAQSVEGLVLLENNHLNFRCSLDLKGEEREQQGFLRQVYLGIL